MRNFTTLSFDDAASRATALVQKCFTTELDLAGAILADPVQGSRVAAEAGFGPASIQRDDVRIILNAIDTKLANGQLIGDGRLDGLSVVLLARDGLRRHHYWDDTQIAGNLGSMLWSNASLLALLNSWPFSSVAINSLIKGLEQINARQRAIEAAYVHWVNLLNGDADPVTGDAGQARREHIIMLPLRQHRKRGAA